MFKKLMSILAVVLAVSLSVPFTAISSNAASGAYLINENFEFSNVGDTNVSGVNVATSTNIKENGTTNRYTSGTINVAEYNQTKALKYHKTMDAKDVACYTDISAGGLKNGSSFVFEFTFWFTGELSGLTFGGEFVGGRKQIDNSAKMKTLLKIDNKNLVDGNGNKITNLVENVKYKIAVFVEDGSSKYTVYFNDVKKSEATYDNSNSDFTGIRALNMTSMKRASDNKHENNVTDFPVFYMDDVKLYYAEKPEFLGGVPSVTPVYGSSQGGGNGGTTNPKPDDPTDDIGGGAIEDTPVVDDFVDKLVQDATTKGPDLSDLAEEAESKYNFEFTGPSISGTANSTTLPSSPVSETSFDVTIILVFSAASVAIIGASVFLKKKFNK